jgi:hypothetical protein
MSGGKESMPNLRTREELLLAMVEAVGDGGDHTGTVNYLLEILEEEATAARTAGESSQWLSLFEQTEFR